MTFPPVENTKCIKRVMRRDTYHSVQCSRANGYGQGGMFCKQHANLVATPSRIVYAVQVGTLPRDEIKPVGLISETEKTVTVTGMYSGSEGSRYTKGVDYRFFDTEMEAVTFIIERAKRDLDRTKAKMFNLQSTIGEWDAKLQAMIQLEKANAATSS